MSIQLSLLNRHAGVHLDLREGDLGCLEIIGKHGPLSPLAITAVTLDRGDGDCVQLAVESYVEQLAGCVLARVWTAR